jgi:predicted nucleic acid-binding protein
MISVDTTFLVDLWRNKDDAGHPAVRILEEHGGETFVVPAHAAGEFLEGGAFVSEKRFGESLRFLGLFGIATAGLETARCYAEIVSRLRKESLLQGASKADLWIAASALEHGTALVTRNAKHFGRVPDLRLIAY